MAVKRAAGNQPTSESLNQVTSRAINYWAMQSTNEPGNQPLGDAIN